jgi:hypothetical protein
MGVGNRVSSLIELALWKLVRQRFLKLNEQKEKIPIALENQARILLLCKRQHHLRVLLLFCLFAPC